jgi:lipid A 3-O-deacylase
MFHRTAFRTTMRRATEGALVKRLVIAAVLAACTAWQAAPAAAEDDPEYLSFRAGGFDVNDDKTTGLLGVEYRSNWKDLILTPMAGGFINGDGGLYGYAGVFVDVFLGRRVVLRPSFAVGAYSDGDGKDLGGVLEFRSAIELAWRFDDRSRLGIELSHLSNAGIYDNNPGTENLTINYSVPLDVFF